MKRRPALALPLLAGALLLAGAAAPTAPAPTQVVAAGDTHIRAQKLELRNVGNDTITLLTGSVEVTSVNLRLTCDRLEIVSVRVDADAGDLVAKENRFKSLIATGRVRIVQPESRREATCGRAEILPGEGRINLTDKPILVDRDEKGEPIRTLAGASMRLFKDESRVEVDLPDISATRIPDLGFDPTKANPPAAGATPAAAPMQSSRPPAK
jgi:lipopolysaccharide export system protein LptA